MDGRSRRITRLLRSYPPSWRDRYGDELRALIEDTHPDGQLPLRAQASIAWAGGHERIRATGLARDGDPADDVRSGALLVLCAWSVLVVGGCAFAKFAEHWDVATPAGSRAVPAAAYTAVVVGGMIGAGLVAVAAMVVAPSFIRYLRSGGWPSIRRSVVRALVATAVAAVATVGIVVWAHHLGPLARNTGVSAYGIAFVAWEAVLVAAIGSWTAAVVATIRRLDLEDHRLRILGHLAMGALVPIALVTVAVLVWWYSVASSTPAFFVDAGPGADGASLAPLIVCAALLAVVATAVGVCGAARVRASLRHLSDT